MAALMLLPERGYEPEPHMAEVRRKWSSSVRALICVSESRIWKEGAKVCCVSRSFLLLLQTTTLRLTLKAIAVLSNPFLLFSAWSSNHFLMSLS